VVATGRTVTEACLIACQIAVAVRPCVMVTSSRVLEVKWTP
jgi:hypothetical protein